MLDWIAREIRGGSQMQFSHELGFLKFNRLSLTRDGHFQVATLPRLHLTLLTNFVSAINRNLRELQCDIEGEWKSDVGSAGRTERR
jgi:hypothetical protein